MGPRAAGRIGAATYAGIILTLILLSACTAKHHVTPSFYYWKTVYAPTHFERQVLDSAGCRRVYLRCFDVGMEAGLAMPRGTVRILQPLDPAFTYVPVVFITHDVLQQTPARAAFLLAHNINILLADICTRHRWTPDEIQIDADWTTGTRATYFALLQSLREMTFFKGRTLSCTIRLHQLKYRLRSGTPPADRGLVMCYNTGTLRQPETRNSILDPAEAEAYLEHLEGYPLPVDIALPLFSWCVQFREGRYRGILRDVPPEAVTGSPLFRHLKQNHFTCLADTVWKGYALRRGDHIRVEAPSLTDIQSVADYAAGRVGNDSLRVVLFHADSLTLSKYSPHDLQALYHTFH